MHNSTASNMELLLIAQAVSREENISIEAVLHAMEQGIQTVCRRRYGQDVPIRAYIDRKNGDISIYRIRSVVNDGEVENMDGEMELSDAQRLQPDVAVGDEVLDLLPPLDRSWVSAQSAKQVIAAKVREAIKEREFNDFKDRVGDIVSGVVKRVEFGNVIIDIGRAEAFLPRHGLIRGETIRQNDRVKAYVDKVVRDNRAPQIHLSRTANGFLAKLFEQEVPEIYDGSIVVQSVARDPGSRAKMAVYTSDTTIDPVGACVGVRGGRVQAITQELQGEKVDIILWTADPATFVVRALTPAEVDKVIIDENRHRIEVVVTPEQQSLAIGRRGQNVRLAAQLVGWHIDILTQDEASKRRKEEFEQTTRLFIEGLDVDEVLANLLASEGFSTIRDILDVPTREMLRIDGFDEGLVEALRERAENYLVSHTSLTEDELETLGVDAALAAVPGINDEILEAMVSKGIETLRHLGDLAVDEWYELFEGTPLADIEPSVVGGWIMHARKADERAGG